MPVTALGDVAKAALAAKFAEIHGPWRVHVTAREALVVYLAARGEGVATRLRDQTTPCCVFHSLL